VDSPYYFESELCGGAVTVSFSKYLPWQAMHLQRSTRFSKTKCFFGWQNNLGEASALHDWKVAMDALTEIGGTPSEHPPCSPDLAPCDFWAFPTMKREPRRKKFRSDQRSAARFREVGGALYEVHRLPREVLRKRDRHSTSTKFRFEIIRRVHELFKRPSYI
jgi:hypothetical protein